MDFEMIAQIISSIGFPIVMAIALLWYINEQRKSHTEEIKFMKDSIDKNTEILAELKGFISLIGERLK